MTKRSPLLRFFRTWMLAFAMLAGVGLYFGWIALPFGAAHEGEALTLIKIIQPWLIFTMLFVTFCKVDPRHLRLRWWHGQHLIFQTLFFLLPGALIWCFPTCTERPVLEGLMLCFICPTATSCAVVTGKLGGDIEGVTTYTILINLLAALLIPMAVPLYQSTRRARLSPLFLAHHGQSLSYAHLSLSDGMGRTIVVEVIPCTYIASQRFCLLSLGCLPHVGYHHKHPCTHAHSSRRAYANRHSRWRIDRLCQPICLGETHWAAHWRTRSTIAGFGTKEYGICHLGWLHLLRPC